MLKGRTGPILVLVGGILSAVGIIVGWTKLTFSYAEIRAEGVTHATPMAIFGAGLLLIGGFFMVRRVTAPRTFSNLIAPVGAILVLFSVGMEFTRSYGAEILDVAPAPQSTAEVRAQVEGLIAAGLAHLDATQTIGLYITLAGGLLGLAGGLLAIRDRPKTASLPAPPA
jgi:hypothetical protein